MHDRAWYRAALLLALAYGTSVLAQPSSFKYPQPRKSEVVELRFFGGLTVEETATALRVSEETVMRDWKLAKAWLLRQLSHEASP